MNQVRPARQQRSSFSWRPLKLVNRIREVQQLYRMGKQEVSDRVYFTLAEVHQCAKFLHEDFGLKLEGLDILEVGPGRLLEHLRALSVKNRVTGIDMEIIPQGEDWSDYVELLRHSPVPRTAQAVMRKLLGGDTLFEKSLAQTFGVEGFARLPVLRMDPTRMTFPEASFDFVCSWSAFENIQRPQSALEEVVRVLRPGGIAYLLIHLDEGRLDAWKQMFQETMPGMRFSQERYEDLRTVCLIGRWQKPRSEVGGGVS
jgi:SAM-dependent methyltransferase